MLRLVLGLYGTAGWAAGVKGEVDDTVPVDTTTTSPGGKATGMLEEANLDTKLAAIQSQAYWSLFEKAFFFGVIITAVVIYIRATRPRYTAPAFEKTSNLA